jgi:hypothetical protein
MEPELQKQRVLVAWELRAYTLRERLLAIPPTLLQSLPELELPLSLQWFFSQLPFLLELESQQLLPSNQGISPSTFAPQVLLQLRMRSEQTLLLPETLLRDLYSLRLNLLLIRKRGPLPQIPSCLLAPVISIGA